MDADGATGLDALEAGWHRVALGRRRRDRLPRGSRVRRRGPAAAAPAPRAPRCYRRLARRLVPGVADTQCGFKVMRGELARSVGADLSPAGFSFDVELLARLQAAGARIDEIPVTWTDVPGSTFVPARHGAGAFAELAAIAWRTRQLGAPATGRATVGARSQSPMPLPAPVALPVALAVPVAASLLGEA